MSHLKWFLGGLITLMFIGCLQAGQGTPMTIKEVEILVQRGIPAGSNKSQIIAFLDARQIEHSDYVEKERAIYAIIRDTFQGTMVKESISIKFHFDENANLKDYRIEEVLTGP